MLRRLTPVLLLACLILTTIAHCQPQCSTEDPSGDLLNIWSGDFVGNVAPWADISLVTVSLKEDILLINISFNSPLEEGLEEGLIIYFAVDYDLVPDNNYKSQPFAGSDTFFSLVLDSTEPRLEKYAYREWGWDSVPTGVSFSLGVKSVVFRVPFKEASVSEEVVFRVISEIKSGELSGVGDFYPDEGLCSASLTQLSVLVVHVPGEVDTVKVDGKEYPVVEGVVEVSLPVGEHSIGIPCILNVGEGERLVFSDWIGANGDCSGTVYVSSGLVHVWARYVREFFVNVSSSVGSACCSGWYEENSSVEISVDPTVMMYGNGTRLVFAEWHGEVGLKEFDRFRPSQVVRVTGPLSVSASWRREYLVRVSGTPCFGVVERWVSEGEVFEFSSPYNCSSDGKIYVFASWTGSITSSNPMLCVRVSGPLVDSVVWKVSVLTELDFVDNDGNPVNVDDVVVRCNGEDFRFDVSGSKASLYLPEGDCVIVGVDVGGFYELVNESLDLGDSNIVGLNVSDLVVVVKDEFGRPVAGKMVVVESDGNKRTVVTGEDGRAVFEDLPPGDYQVSIGDAPGKRIRVSGDTSVEFVPQPWWPLIALTGLVIGGLVGGYYFVAKRRCIKERLRFEELKEELFSLASDVDITYDTPFHLSANIVDNFVRERNLREFVDELEKMRERARSILGDRSLRRIESRIEHEKKELGSLSDSNKFLKSRLDYFLKREERLLPQLKRPLGEIVELVSKYTRCFSCSQLEDLEKRLFKTRENLFSAKSLIEESRRLVQEIRDKNVKEKSLIKEKMEECMKRLQRIRDFVSSVFQDFLPEKSSDNVPEGVPFAEGVFWGVKLRIVSKEGFDKFFNIWDKWEDRLSKVSCDYWNAKKCLHETHERLKNAEAHIEVCEELLEYLDSRARLLNDAIEVLDRALRALDKAKIKCQLMLSAIKTQTAKIIEEVIRGGKPAPSEPSSSDVYGKLISTKSSLEAKKTSYRFLLEDMKEAKKQATELIRELDGFLKDPPFNKKYLKKLKNTAITFRDLRRSAEELIKDIDNIINWLNSTLSEADANLSGIDARIRDFRRKMDEGFREMLERLEKAGSPDECMRIRDEFWRSWRDILRSVDGYERAESRFPGDDKIQELRTTIFERLRWLKDSVNETKRRAVISVALLRAAEVMPKNKLPEIDSFARRLGKAFDDAYKAADKIFGNLSYLVDEFEKRGIVFMSDNFKNFAKVPSTAITWINRIKAAVGAVKTLPKKIEKPEDALEKIATVLDLASAFAPLEGIPLLGVALSLYSEFLEFGVHMAKWLRSTFVDLFWSDIIEEKRLDAKFSLEFLLKGELKDVIEKIAGEINEFIGDMDLSRQAARRYIAERLLGEVERGWGG